MSIHCEIPSWRGRFRACPTSDNHKGCPHCSNGAIVYDELFSVNDMPSGWADSQNGGPYLLTRWSGKTLFGYLEDARRI